MVKPFGNKVWACLRVEDHLRHGDFEDIRTVTILPTYEAWLSLLNSGPYGQGQWLDNRFTLESWERFESTGVSDFGWRTFRKV
jgi:hypothetical protein